MTCIIPYIVIGVVVLTLGPMNAVQASGSYDGTWSGSKPTSGKARCGMGKTTLTILDNSVKGEVERLFIDVRDVKEKDQVLSALMKAGANRIITPSGGAGTIDATGSIIIAGTVTRVGCLTDLSPVKNSLENSLLANSLV